MARLVAGAAERAVRVAKRPLPALYHIGIVVLSAAVASSLPFTFSFVARRLLTYWSFVENENVFLISTEVAVALFLILVFGHLRTSWRNRTLGKMARAAGMVSLTPRKGVLARRTAKRSKAQQARMRDILVIGSTGVRTLVDPNGDLHTAIRTCRSARVLLLHPESRGAIERARSIPDSGVTRERLRSQVRQTVVFLGALRAAQTNVRVKLYADPPLLKLAILGDHAWVQHYHPGLDVQVMPEYVFTHEQNPVGLYTALYQYFVTRWNDPAIPEYDLVADELVYRDDAGNEIRRERIDVAPDEGRASGLHAGDDRGRLDAGLTR